MYIQERVVVHDRVKHKYSEMAINKSLNNTIFFQKENVKF